MKKKLLFYFLLYSIGFILLVQGVYFTYLFGIKPDSISVKNFEKPVSIIICAHNEAKNLPKFLAKFLSQNYKTYELILVNDRSTDSSLEVLNMLCNQFPNLKVITIESTPKDWNPKKWALQKGVEIAQFDYLLFSDADCFPASENWLQNMANGFLNSNFVIGIGRYQKLNGFLNTFIQYETYQTTIAMIGLAQKGINYMSVGRNFGAKKSAYLNFAWDTIQSISGGDDDLFLSKQKQNSTTIITQDAHTISIPKTTFKSYILQKLRHIQISKHYSFLNQSIIGMFNLSSLLFYLLLILSIFYPILAFVAIIFRTSIIFYNFVIASKCNIVGLRFIEILYLDLIYVLFLWTIGPVALIAKKIRWK